MYIYRALNKFDLATVEQNLGMYSKDILVRLKEEILLNQNIFDSNIHIKDLINNPSFTSIVNKQISEDLNKDIRKDIAAHLLNGTHVPTRWISFSKSPFNMLDFYVSQDINKVAVLDRNCSLENTFGYGSIDTSNKESIDKLYERNALLRKDGEPVDQESLGIKFAIKNREILYYIHVPQEKIKYILNPFEMDLIYNDIKLLIMDPNSIIKIYDKFHQVSQGLTDSTQRFIFRKHYCEHKSINYLANSDSDIINLKNAKRLILYDLFTEMNKDGLIRRKSISIGMPEDKLKEKIKSPSRL